MKTNKQKILVVDDEAAVRRILEVRLSMFGYEVVTAADGKEALVIFWNEVPNLVVLDVMLPKLDGLGVCQALRKESGVPIILLSALGDVADRIVGLELGADDYLVKPFSPKELEARIRSLLRRVGKIETSGIPHSGVVRIGTLQIDTHKRQVYKGYQRIRLTDLEFRLLELLVRQAGKPVSRSEIRQKVFGYSPDFDAGIHVVAVHIAHLRAKLEDDPSNPELIITCRGRGYFFQRFIQLESDRTIPNSEKLS